MSSTQTLVGKVSVGVQPIEATEAISNFEQNQDDFFIALKINDEELTLDLSALRQLKALLCDSERRLMLRQKEALLRRNLVLDL